MNLARSAGTVRLQRDIPLRYDVDILVAGGGPAGVAAAITAARQGRRVLLVEALNCLGGMGTAGLLPVSMPFADAVHFYAGGFGCDLLNRMQCEGGTTVEKPWGPLIPVIRAEALKRIYDDMIAEAGVEVLLVTRLVAVEAQAGRVTHAICGAKSGLFAAAAQTFVDGTGDGDLCAWAGAPFEKGDAEGRMMGGTLCSLWAGIDWAAAAAAGVHAEHVLIEALRANPGLLPQPGESYGIPYRCLTPRGLANVLVAGRCVSTDRAVQSSLRVMPACFITGQACGMAAAMVAEGAADTRAVDVRRLQSRLKGLGAFLPNAKGKRFPAGCFSASMTWNNAPSPAGRGSG